MQLDRTFATQIKRQSNGNGSREAKFAFKKKVEETARALSTPTVMDDTVFTSCLKEHGRVPVAICVAETIIERHEQLTCQSYSWAQEVMKLYTNAPPDKMFAYIDDGLHPSRIEEYASSLISVTTLEE